MSGVPCGDERLMAIEIGEDKYCPTAAGLTLGLRCV